MLDEIASLCECDSDGGKRESTMLAFFCVSTLIRTENTALLTTTTKWQRYHQQGIIESTKVNINKWYGFLVSKRRVVRSGGRARVVFAFPVLLRHQRKKRQMRHREKQSEE